MAKPTQDKDDNPTVHSAELDLILAAETLAVRMVHTLAQSAIDEGPTEDMRVDLQEVLQIMSNSKQRCTGSAWR